MYKIIIFIAAEDGDDMLKYVDLTITNEVPIDAVAVIVESDELNTQRTVDGIIFAEFGKF